MKLFHHYCVYILQCNDGYYYTGITNDIERRLWEHNTGHNKNSFTYNRRPLQVKYIEIFDDANQAITWEKQIKGWSRKKKEALFNEDWEKIMKLAKNRTGVDTRFRKGKGKNEK